MSESNNELEVVNRFTSYLGEMKIGDAFGQVLDDCISEDISEGQATEVIDLLIAETVIRFAESYNWSQNRLRGAIRCLTCHQI